jgi:hypothetical protein
MSSCHGGVWSAIHPDKGNTKIHNTAPVNPASSTNRILATNCVFTMQFCENPLAKHQPCTMVRKSKGLHSLAWCGLSDCSWRILQRKGTQIPSAAVVLHTHWFWNLLALFSTCELLKNSPISQ